MRRISQLLLLALSFFLILPNTFVKASTLDVQASVPFDLPTEPSVITTPPNATAVTSASQVIAGTCGQLTPAAIVSIWRNGQLLGSTTCMSGGVFSATVQLLPGGNTLLPRTSNISGLYGPDGPSFSISYQQPPTASPAIPPTSNGIINPPTDNPVIVYTEQVFQTIATEDTQVFLRVTVQGGETPYSISINWGNGSTEQRSVNAPGVYEFRYNYDQINNYKITITVTDVRGVVATYSLPVVGLQTPPPDIDQPNSVIQNTGRNTNNWWWPLGLVFASLIGYYVGYRRRKNEALEQKVHTQSVKSSTTHRKKLPLKILLVLGIGATTLAIYYWATQPSTKQLGTSDITNVQGEIDSPQFFRDELVTFSYPSDYRQKLIASDSFPPIIRQLLFTHRDTWRSDQLAITVGEAETTDLGDLSAVQSRRLEPIRYRPVRPAGAPVNSVSFEQSSPYELSTFWIENGRYVAVVTSGTTDQSSALSVAQSATLTSWRWQP